MGSQASRPVPGARSGSWRGVCVCGLAAHGWGGSARSVGAVPESRMGRFKGSAGVSLPDGQLSCGAGWLPVKLPAAFLPAAGKALMAGETEARLGSSLPSLPAAVTLLGSCPGPHPALQHGQGAH